MHASAWHVAARHRSTLARSGHASANAQTYLLFELPPLLGAEHGGGQRAKHGASQQQACDRTSAARHTARAHRSFKARGNRYVPGGFDLSASCWGASWRTLGPPRLAQTATPRL